MLMRRPPQKKKKHWEFNPERSYDIISTSGLRLGGYLHLEISTGSELQKIT